MPFGENLREREHFSLEMRTIRPSADFGARRENDLRRTGYAWTPDLWSFLELQEVGFSPYLKFYSHLNVLLMFRLNEAVRGRLIGPKTWDQIIRNFLETLTGRFCPVRGYGLFGCRLC